MHSSRAVDWRIISPTVDCAWLVGLERLSTQAMAWWEYDGWNEYVDTLCTTSTDHWRAMLWAGSVAVLDGRENHGPACDCVWE